jgi:hypothetical protein
MTTTAREWVRRVTPPLAVFVAGWVIGVLIRAAV